MHVTQTGPMAGEIQGDRIRDRLHCSLVRVWGSINRSVRSSVTVAVKVESSLALLAAYSAIGFSTALLLGVPNG